MNRKRWSAGLLALALAIGLASPAWADPPAGVPGGPCIEDQQQVRLDSLPSYQEVARQLASIEQSSQGAVEVRSAGRSGEGRELLYATVGHGPDVFWLQARIHGNELHSTEAVLQVLKYLASSGDPVATRIRQQLTVMVIPMYNPDGAEANIRQSTTPLQIDLNRDWELFRQPESRAWYALWEQTHPRLALDLHHMGQSPVVEGTNQLNTFQIGARSIDPSRMTEEQWLTNRQMALLSVDAVQRLGTGNVARYPLIDITNAVISRMLLGGPGPDGSDPGFRTQGAIFYEVRSVGQKSNGMLEQLFARPTMAVLAAAADGSLYAHPGTGWEDIPFGDGEPCGGGPS
ncbi:MAG TPA: M14 family zinc carboxypeptidase [Actinomycetota bacterium]|nr:M14 family zinc carboxypeptidase [Actinomycetota bacterium]